MDKYRAKRIQLTKRSPAYWRVTFNHSSMCVFEPEAIVELTAIVTAIETDEHVKVVVMNCAFEGQLLTCCGLRRKFDNSARRRRAPTGLRQLRELLLRVSEASVVSIASIRECTNGIGRELARVSDLKFATREKVIVTSPEFVGGAASGRAEETLSQLIGRGRALEQLLDANDIWGNRSDRSDFFHRSLSDSQLDCFVEELATQIASFDKCTITDAKRLLNMNSSLRLREITSERVGLIASVTLPAGQTPN